MPSFNRIASVELTPFNNTSVIARRIDKLRISFIIEKFNNIELNTAKIEISNMSDLTRSDIEETQQIVLLRAGYLSGSGEEILFTGNSTRIYSEDATPNINTFIEAQDGEKALSESKVNLSFAENVSTKVILREILKKIPIANKIVRESELPNKKLIEGFSFIGSAKVALKKMTDSLDLTASVQNNELVLFKNGTSDDTDVFVVTPKTGLIGRPEKLDELSKEGKKTTKRTGLLIRSLLLPRVVPGNRIQISSAEINPRSTYTVHKATHKGDTHGNDFLTELEVFE